MSYEVDKKQHDMLLELSERDIKELKRVRGVISGYTKYEQELVNDLTVRMKAYGLSELGDLRLVKEFGLETVEFGKVLDNILNEELVKKIMVNIDIEKTIENLKEKSGYSEVQIKPLIDLIKLKFGVVVERLEVK